MLPFTLVLKFKIQKFKLQMAKMNFFHVHSLCNILMLKILNLDHWQHFV